MTPLDSLCVHSVLIRMIKSFLYLDFTSYKPVVWLQMCSDVLGNVFSAVMVFLHRDFVIMSLSMSAVSKSATTLDLRVHFLLAV